MHPVSTEDISLESPPRSLWRSLGDLAISIAMVAAVALIAGFLGVTVAHAQGRGELRSGYQKAAIRCGPPKAQGTLLEEQVVVAALVQCLEQHGLQLADIQPVPLELRWAV